MLWKKPLIIATSAVFVVASVGVSVWALVQYRNESKVVQSTSTPAQSAEMKTMNVPIDSNETNISDTETFVVFESDTEEETRVDSEEDSVGQSIIPNIKGIMEKEQPRASEQNEQGDQMGQVEEKTDMGLNEDDEKEQTGQSSFLRSVEGEQTAANDIGRKKGQKRRGEEMTQTENDSGNLPKKNSESTRQITLKKNTEAKEQTKKRERTEYKKGKKLQVKLPGKKVSFVKFKTKASTIPAHSDVADNVPINVSPFTTPESFVNTDSYPQTDSDPVVAEEAESNSVPTTLPIETAVNTEAVDSESGSDPVGTDSPTIQINKTEVITRVAYSDQEIEILIQASIILANGAARLALDLSHKLAYISSAIMVMISGVSEIAARAFFDLMLEWVELCQRLGISVIMDYLFMIVMVVMAYGRVFVGIIKGLVQDGTITSVIGALTACLQWTLFFMYTAVKLSREIGNDLRRRLNSPDFGEYRRSFFDQRNFDFRRRN